MCDLIDLRSPDGKNFQGPKLASPLIPAPTDNVRNNNSNTNETNSLMVGKRDSLDNNPFDMVLCKTTEYIQKKDDPFEIALEKALESKLKNSVALRTCSVDFIDDFSPRCRKPRQVLKMNRTLDETSINEELNLGALKKKVLFNEVSDEVKPNLDNCNIVGEDKKMNSDNLPSTTITPKVPNIEIYNADLSILNVSVMNDILFEPGCESENGQMKPVLPEEKSMSSQKDNIEQSIGKSILNLKVPKLRRSLSQGDKLSPRKKHFNCIPHLALENLRGNFVNNDSTYSILSTNSDDVLNEGFLKNQYSRSSVCSSLSNISAITRLSSVTSMTISPTMSSDGTINRAFLEGSSLEKTNNRTCSEKKDSIEDTNFVSPTSTCSVNSMLSTKDKASTLTPNLIQQCSRLKKNSPENCIPRNDSIEKRSNLSTDCNASMAIAKTINKEDSLSNKLIDIDVFPPENNYTKQHINLSSDTSSDSVFVEENRIYKSILHEAKILARTFEEMALKTSSGSSIDDLISSNPLWTSELLPAFDDEAVDNLIELPASPNNVCSNNINSKTEQTAKAENSIGNDSKVVANAEDVKIELNEFVPIEKRITMATLLLDLKKLIETENNTQVNALLENLESALGVKCMNNTELLTTCLSTSNNLTKTPRKLSENLSSVENAKENSAEESKEENLDAENVNLNDLNTSKCTPNRKFLKEVNSEFENVILEVDKSTNRSLEVMNVQSNEDEISILHKSQKSHSSSKIENANSLNEKMALELLTTLAKLLTGKTEEQLPTDLIQNLRKVLNSDSNNCNVSNKTETDSSPVEIQQTPKKSAFKSEKRIRSSALSKSPNRYSLNEESKKSSAPKPLRRSISASHSSSMKIMPSQLLSKDKSTSQLKEIKKRFPSDSALVNSVSTKKTVDSVSSATKINNGKDTGRKSIKALNVQRDKPTLITDAVKSKLKMKTDTEITGKKGPMKAVHPIGNMQKKEAFEKKMSPSTGTVTPPKSHKIISSTPNSIDKGCAVKRSPRSKPVASSTPDAQSSKAHEIQSSLAISKKRNFSCDISPVVTHVNVDNSNGVKGSPKRINKPLSPKRTTPKRQPADSNIPKCRTPPVMKNRNSLYDVNRSERFSESLQHSRNKRSDIQKVSPSPLKNNGSKIQQSPLRDSNKFSPKIKPLNLISKLRRHSHDINVIEKENVYI